MLPFLNLVLYYLSCLFCFINVAITELLLKVKKQGDELYRQVFLTQLSFIGLKQKIASKYNLSSEEKFCIVLLPDIAILDDDDVGTLSYGDVLEIQK